MDRIHETDHQSVYRFERVTHGISIHVMPIFVEQESRPEDHYYLWAYQVRIENQGRHSIKILDRQWSVIDDRGMNQFVSGAGVFEEPPVLKPGDAFEYTNTIPLKTTSGMIAGCYTIDVGGGECLDIEAPLFSLDSPYETKLLN